MIIGSLIVSVLPKPKDRVKVVYLTMLFSLETENFLLAFSREPYYGVLDRLLDGFLCLLWVLIMYANRLWSHVVIYFAPYSSCKNEILLKFNLITLSKLSVFRWDESVHEFEFVALYIWLIIDKIEDVVVGSSIPYNYEKSRF